MSHPKPAYLRLLNANDLVNRVNSAHAHLAICNVCALHCPVNRLEGELGSCKTGAKARVSSFGPHMGEENPLRGWRGSGTIFFVRCNMHCVYCQNHEISQTDAGEEVEPEEIASMMLQLQSYGCHNINFVSPSHVVPQILAAISIASSAGLSIPLVYNSGGYDSMEMLALLDGIIDIYMPDMKYANATTAQRFSKIPNYPRVNQIAVREMHRQVGDLIVDSRGIAIRGLLVRHLVLPNNLANTEQIVRFLAEEISSNTYLNLMPQYHPAYKATAYPELNRSISGLEYQNAVQLAHKAGLRRLDEHYPLW